MAFLKFPIYRSHLDLAKTIWEKHLFVGAKIIDATCGNGKDSLYLAKATLSASKGELFCLDIQHCAISNTSNLLKTHLEPELFKKVSFYQNSFETFPEASEGCDMIIYNLGYLPGGDKSITTEVKSTLASVKRALTWIRDGGVISISCYIGHKQGSIETIALKEYLNTLDSKHFAVCCHSFLNRNEAPLLILIQKATSE